MNSVVHLRGPMATFAWYKTRYFNHLAAFDRSNEIAITVYTVFWSKVMADQYF